MGGGRVACRVGGGFVWRVGAGRGWVAGVRFRCLVAFFFRAFCFFRRRAAGVVAGVLWFAGFFGGGRGSWPFLLLSPLPAVGVGLGRCAPPGRCFGGLRGGVLPGGGARLCCWWLGGGGVVGCVCFACGVVWWVVLVLGCGSGFFVCGVVVWGCLVWGFAGGARWWCFLVAGGLAAWWFPGCRGGGGVWGCCWAGLVGGGGAGWLLFGVRGGFGVLVGGGGLLCLAWRGFASGGSRWPLWVGGFWGGVLGWVADPCSWCRLAVAVGACSRVAGGAARGWGGGSRLRLCGRARVVGGGGWVAWWVCDPWGCVL